MQHLPNKADEREAFKRGYEQGQSDARVGKSRQLCESPRGTHPPVTKADDSAYYHGYKAGRDDLGAWEPAFRSYAAKHGKASFVQLPDRIERTLITNVKPGQTFWLGRGKDFRPVNEDDGRKVAVTAPRRGGFGDCIMEVLDEQGLQRPWSTPCHVHVWVDSKATQDDRPEDVMRANPGAYERLLDEYAPNAGVLSRLGTSRTLGADEIHQARQRYERVKQRYERMGRTDEPPGYVAWVSQDPFGYGTGPGWYQGTHEELTRLRGTGIRAVSELQPNGKYFLDVKLEAGHHRKNGVQVDIPRKQGETTSVFAHGRVLHIKLVSRGNYHLRVEGEQRARWASTVAEVREDAQHFLDSGALPPPAAQHYYDNAKRQRRPKRAGRVSDVDEAAVQKWMADNVDDFFEPGTGEIQPTQLAEAAALEFDLDESWYAPGSALWDWAIYAFEDYDYSPNAAPGTAARLDQVGPNIWGIAYDVRLQRGSFKVYFRIDSRDGSFRVDKKGLPFEPWEAIDGGSGFATLKAASEHIRAWKRLAEQQDTLTPRMERRRS